MAEITLQKARALGPEIVYVRWLDDAARGTPEDADAVRSRVHATQVNTYDREEVVQASSRARADGTLQHRDHATHQTDGVWWRDDRRTPLVQKEEVEPTRIRMEVKQQSC